ncbi:MAG: hypothetical protein Nk1A_5330 [Endomicrobiia bacterium]|nr:MAG: hypothetical protein Nk1A_5330 [Endomicrobiia bacterium]
MKKFVLLTAFIAVLSLSLSACGNEKKNAEIPNEPNAEQQESVPQQDVTHDQASDEMLESSDQGHNSK